jgi:hypothetical protein
MRKFFGVMVVVVCTMALGLNLQYAFDGYGIKTGALHKIVLADGTGTGTDGTGTGSTGGTGTGGTGTGSTGGTDTGSASHTYIPGETRCQTNKTTTSHDENGVNKWTSVVKVCAKGNELSCEFGTVLTYTDENGFLRSEGSFWPKSCD